MFSRGQIKKEIFRVRRELKLSGGLRYDKYLLNLDFHNIRSVGSGIFRSIGLQR